MMGPSPYLPDTERLAKLFSSAGARIQPAGLPPGPARSLTRFPSTEAEAPGRVDAQLGPAPLAELDEADARDVIGPLSSSETLEGDLESLLLWLSGSTGAFAAFVVDSDGLALANRHAPESYLVATAALGLAERAMSQYVPRPTEGSTVVDLDGANVLHIIWATTSAGRMAVGLVLAEPLPRALAAKARRVLRTAVERKGFSR
jgi:hypothetical protein